MKEFFRTRCTLQISSWEGSHHASLALPLSLTIIYTSSHFCLGSGVTHPAHRGQIYYLFSFLFITPTMEVSEGELWCCCEGERGSSWLRDPWSWRQLLEAGGQPLHPSPVHHAELIAAWLGMRVALLEWEATNIYLEGDSTLCYLWLQKEFLPFVAGHSRMDY